MARKYQQEEYLRKEYIENDKTTYDIAAEFGVSNQTICNWLEKHDIPTRGAHARKGTEYTRNELVRDKEALKELYVDKKMSAQEIANQENISSTTVLNWLDKHNIERRSIKDAYEHASWAAQHPKLEDEEWLREKFKEEGMTMYAISQELGVSTPAVIYRLDEFGIERPEREGFTGGDTEFQRDPKWTAKREVALERDNHTCQDCGTKESEVDRSLDVHHKRPKDEFVDDDGNVNWERANNPDNLVSLCHSCHMKRHWSG